MITVNDREDFLRSVKYYLPDKPGAAEIGVLHGGFSNSILKIIIPSFLTLIDPFERGDSTYSEGLGFLPSAYSTDEDYENVCKRFATEIKGNRVCVDRRYSYETLADYYDGSFDFIYHDASHLYEDIKRDLNYWLPKLNPGGLMCGHDYIEHESFGVMQAVDEFCKEHNFEMIIFNTNGGDYALRRKV